MKTLITATVILLWAILLLSIGAGVVHVYTVSGLGDAAFISALCFGTIATISTIIAVTYLDEGPP